MLILTAVNKTPGRGTNANGTADYSARVAINDRTLWAGPVTGHTRAAGAAELLRRIADTMDRDLKRNPFYADIMGNLKAESAASRNLPKRKRK